MARKRKMSLSAALDAMADDVDGVREYVQDEMLKRIKRRTPVDTGTARDSWFMDYDKGLFSSDNPDKILALEYGHSDQAPNGMVRVTIAEIPDIVNRYKP